MNFDRLKEEVWRVNLDLARAGLAILTWGNASGVDRAAGVMVIKPSGVDYASLRPEHMVAVSLETGQALEGGARPSSDTPTHRVLYNAFPSIGGVIHTHSMYATSFAQALRPITCMGTTHADYFHGEVPLTRALEDSEIERDYELNTGKVIVERFAGRGADGLNPLDVPAVLVAHHGPFVWGASPAEALENALVLEAVAQMNARALALNPAAAPIDKSLLNKHFFRKHGENAYYGQNPKGGSAHEK